PDNPFTEAVKLSVPLVGYERNLLSEYVSLTEQLSGGVILRLPRQWTAQGEYTLGSSTYTYDRAPATLTPEGRAALVNGTLNPLSDVNVHRLDFSSFYPSGLRWF